MSLTLEVSAAALCDGEHPSWRGRGRGREGEVRREERKVIKDITHIVQWKKPLLQPPRAYDNRTKSSQIEKHPTKIANFQSNANVFF